jgi:inhibitor of Bruton tyrosine kinase
MYSKYLDTRTCTPKCHSSQHANELTNLLTKTNDEYILICGLQQCWNCQSVCDSIGRHVIHMAASCGRTECCEWLIKYKKADISLVTLENKWTPAHCAAFYGTNIQLFFYFL